MKSMFQCSTIAAVKFPLFFNGFSMSRRRFQNLRPITTQKISEVRIHECVLGVCGKISPNSLSSIHLASLCNWNNVVLTDWMHFYPTPTQGHATGKVAVLIYIYWVFPVGLSWGYLLNVRINWNILKINKLKAVWYLKFSTSERSLHHLHFCNRHSTFVVVFKYFLTCETGLIFQPANENWLSLSTHGVTSYMMAPHIVTSQWAAFSDALRRSQVSVLGQVHGLTTIDRCFWAYSS